MTLFPIRSEIWRYNVVYCTKLRFIFAFALKIWNCNDYYFVRRWWIDVKVAEIDILFFVYAFVDIIFLFLNLIETRKQVYLIRLRARPMQKIVQVFAFIRWPQLYVTKYSMTYSVRRRIWNVAWKAIMRTQHRHLDHKQRHRNPCRPNRKLRLPRNRRRSQHRS